MVGDTFGGGLSDWVFKLTGDLAKARRNVVIGSLLGSLVFLTPVFFVHDIALLAATLSAAFFCLELTIGPIWPVPMDIAPQHAATPPAIMNTGSAIAAIASPCVFSHAIA